MNPYSIPQLISSIIPLILVYFVLKNKRNLSSISFSLMCIGGSTWLFSLFVMYNIKVYNVSLFNLLNKICYVGVTLIPMMNYRFVTSLLKIRSRIIYYIYGLAILFIIIDIFTNLLIDGVYKFFWGYYPKAGPLHPLYLVYTLSLFLISWKHLYITYRKYKDDRSNIKPIDRLIVKYVFLAFVIGNIGAIDFVQSYNIEFYPFGCFNITIFLIIFTYIIVKYRLMDIKVAITRAGIFVAVYTLVLGVPFALAIGLKAWLIEIFGPIWWMAPLILMAVLATAGPFIYIYIQRKAEERLLREQKRYQDTLKQASVGMTRIRNLRKLLDLITHIVTRTVKISYAAIYLYNQETNEYLLQVSRDKGRVSLTKLTSDNPLVAWIMVKRQPLIYEEVKRQMEDTSDATYMHLEKNMQQLNAAVVIPSFLEDKIIGLIVLGDKLSGQIYTPEDLNVFQVLASQAALAIENAQFYEETKEMQEQIAQAEKMATIGTMADGLSHQINNRFYALSLIAGDTIDTIKMTDTSKCTPEVKEMLEQINHALERIEANVMQGGEVVRGILKYTRKGEEKFEPITLDQILDGTLEMVQYKVKLSEVDILRNYPRDCPKIKGNLTQLQECFFNFIDNAYDAIVERQAILKEAGYRGRIIFSCQPKGDNLEIIIEDNGMGIKEQNTRKIFTPFFTTKTSARRGTGLGLYVLRRIITDTHKGNITFESRYQVGTRFILELPIAK